jgi:hypothetical protein
MPFLRRDRRSGYFRESNQAEGLILRMGMKHHWISTGLSPNPILRGCLRVDYNDILPS